MDGGSYFFSKDDNSALICANDLITNTSKKYAQLFNGRHVARGLFLLFNKSAFNV